MAKFRFSVLFLVVLGLVSFNLYSQDKKGVDIKDLVKEAQSKVKMISVDDLKKKLDANENIILIDVRDIEDYRQGHVDKALHISRGSIEFTLKEKVDSLKKMDLKKSDQLILMCKNGQRSSLAAESLMKLGYTNILVVKGGLDEWLEKKYPVTRGLGIQRGEPKQLDPKAKEELMKKREELKKKREEQQQKKQETQPEQEKK